MRLRVIVTNGNINVDLFWLNHDGKDVYFGIPKTNRKRTYHKSGKIHTTHDGIKTEEVWTKPLKDLDGQFHLTTINIGNAKSWVNAQHSRHEYTGKQSDCILSVDTRVIPESVQTNIAIGLLEPLNLNPLTRLIKLISPQQILLSTEVEPWVYALLFWFSDFDEITKRLSSGRRRTGKSAALLCQPLNRG